MQATKASAPLFLAAALCAVLAARAISTAGERRRSPRREREQVDPPPDKPQVRSHSGLTLIVVTVIAALATGALLYSSFGTNPGGLRDAFNVYAQALTRFGAEAPPTGHEKPWWYYLRMFGWYREGGLVWHQAAFSALAVAGVVVAAARRERFLSGVAIYTLAIVGAFSLFAYKTPWHTVHFIPGMALLAAAALAAISRLKTGRLVAIAFALLTIATLYQQTGRAAFLRPGDQRNPYAYVHSSFDVLKYRALAEAAAAPFPDQPIRVISEEYWPLPWYLRGIPRVGFYAAPPEECDGALVIVSASQADAVRPRLRGNYRETFLGLRPGFACILFTREP
jgi:predicted membrane-bound mannosyltransferase